MNKRWLALILIAISLPLAAQQAGYTARAVELKRQPQSDAEVLASLPAQTPIGVLSRQGAWMQVQAGAQTGWLRLLSVRMGAAGMARKGESGWTKMFNVARSGSSGAVTTTGVRGLGKDDIANARPNPAELAKLDAYMASEADARALANQAPLKARAVPYVSASGSPE